MKKEKNKSYIKLLKYSKKYIKYQKIPLILAPLLLLVSIMTPFLIRYFIDDIIGKNKFSQILPFFFFFVLVVLLERIISFLLTMDITNL